MADNTSAENMELLNGMMRAVVTDIEVVSYDELVYRFNLSRIRRKQLKEDYPSVDFVLHLFMDFNQSELERQSKKVKAAVAKALAADGSAT